MIDWKERYNELFKKYLSTSSSYTSQIDNEIDFINNQIAILQKEKKFLEFKKHRQEKQKLEEIEISKANLRDKIGGKLPGE